MTTSDFDKAIEAAQAALNDGKEQEAFSVFRPVLDFPGLVATTKTFADAMKAFSPLAQLIGGEKLDKLVLTAADVPDDDEALFDLAYALYEHQLFSFAATILARANAIAPNSSKILAELATTFEMMMYYHQARSVLKASPDALAEDPFLRYLLAFHTLMCGDVSEARKVLDEVMQTQDEQALAAAQQLEHMVVRAEELLLANRLGEKDLRGWHLALNGSILLQLSPFGFNEGMNGRYAYLQDSYGLIHEACRRLKQFIKEAKLKVERVYRLEERSSAILATALAQILDLPIVEWGEEGQEEPGLIVAYDLAYLFEGEVLNQLQIHRQGQILWAHASCWTNPFTYSPDITTFLYQRNTAPWAPGGMIYNCETKDVTISEGDNSPVEELAQKILEADAETIEDGDDPANLLSILKKCTTKGIPGLWCKDGFRARQRAGSPVPSSRFL